MSGRVFLREKRCKSVGVEIWVGNQKTALAALVDSGNLLTDPMTGKPVVLVSKSALQGVIPTAMLILEEPEKATALPYDVQRRVRILPLHGVGGKGLVLGYRPDCILLFEPDNPKSKNAVDAIVGLYPEKSNCFSGYPANVPSSLL